MGKIKVVIADDIGETRELIKTILTLKNKSFEIIGEASNGKEVLDLMKKQQPDIVLMDINMPVMNGLEATEKITEEFPSVTVIIMSVQAESEYLKRAMFSGAKEYIIKPFTYNVLVETIIATYEKNKDRRISMNAYSQNKRNADIITFYSSKGGVGKSVLSVNSAVTLSNSLNKKTLLIDIDLQFGDISMLINKHTEKTIIDIIDDSQLDSYENIKQYLYQYNENLDILLAPRKPESAEYIGKEVIEKMIGILKNEYDVIIVDTGVNFNDETLYILDVSKYVIFVTTMEIVALKNTKLGLEVMKSLNYDNDKVKLVINGTTTKYGISENDVKAVFKETIFSMIPEDIKTVRTSVNKGIPFCDINKNKGLKIVKAIKNICKELTN